MVSTVFIFCKCLKPANSPDNYTCFAIEDLDGNKIEISYYDKQNNN